jgi:hypothetical protein
MNRRNQLIATLTAGTGLVLSPSAVSLATGQSINPSRKPDLRSSADPAVENGDGYGCVMKRKLNGVRGRSNPGLQPVEKGFFASGR